MRFLIIILLSICIICFSVGQERNENILLQEMIWVKMLGKSNQIYVEFEEGDSAVFDIKVSKGKKIRKYSIYDSKGKLLKVNKRQSRLTGTQAESINITEKGEYYVLFKNAGLLPREVNLTIKKYPKPLRDTSFWEEKPLEETSIELGPSDRMSLDTISSDSVIKVTKKIVQVTYDTLVEELLATSLILDSKLNLGGQSKKTLDIPINPKPNTRYYWTGWIGVGDDALAAYEKLQSKPPLSWQQAGISIPLEAYGKGLTYLLPTGSNSVMLDVFYVNKEKTNAFLHQGSFIRYGKEGILGNLPRLFWSEASNFNKVLPIVLCLENKEQISQINVHVKIMGFQITKTEETKEIPVFESVKKTKKISETVE